MRLSLSPVLTVTVKYLWQRYRDGGMLWFKRRVPRDLQGVLGSQWVQQSLGTEDLKVAARLIAQLVREQDKHWKSLRSTSTDEGIDAKARLLLTEYGIHPDRLDDTHEGALWAFHDLLDEQLPDHIREASTVPPEVLDRYLPPVHRTAFQIQQGRLKHRASDCQREYAARKTDSAQALKSATLPFQYLIELCGDKPLGDYRRSDVRRFVDHLEKGKHAANGKPISTTTIQRYITTLRAAFNRSVTEHELPIKNVWAGSIEYSKDAKGEQKRETFTVKQYQALQKGVGDIGQTDDLGAMLTLIANTGARLAEIAGLRNQDCHPSAQVPYIDIRPYESRDLKTPASTRKVPLTPTALQALRRALSLATGDYLFGRYTDDKGCRANAASAALGIRLRSYGITATTHGMRHGMRDLLRAAECPENIVCEIQGWAQAGHVAKYGKGSPLGVLAKWLEQAAAEAARIPTKSADA
ncbi:Phage integrase family protein [Caballeronia terrestris]|uniref:Phage integrase family protein n=1 Tax=Caballeronia terrestris TaxID=1226301 RepID=A0A158FWS5_9BURK|nr:DUF6538 domain-containing protein [Caballeronia terrestris]SAL24294.1 Phage integrase family protein [Caballeronia terrestris]